MSTPPLLRVVHAIDALNEFVGRGVAWLTLIMVLVTFTVVLLRYGFNLGWIAMQESITYMHAAVFMLGAGYTLLHDGHVRVDIFYRGMAPKRKAAIDLFGALFLLLPTFLFLIWASWDYVADSWAVQEASAETGGIPYRYLLKSVILLMAGLMILQGLSQALRSLLILLGRIEPVVEPMHEEV
ncbi:MAG: TRAP transporter small permease subunit [Gammaproteobacteria bacterium]|nr:TRAP transporter small permease subunit [Gammaproteobacteria bacterium]MCP5138103.1 TRAP transporter small permease subunit [Gammaproteobacteria bacterium]